MAKVTPWFPPEIKPVRAGWYETYILTTKDHRNYRYWSSAGAWLIRPLGELCWIQDRNWRGLSEQPK